MAEDSETINQYFSSIGRQLAERIKDHDRIFDPNPADCIFVWDWPISESDFLDEIMKIDA